MNLVESVDPILTIPTDPHSVRHLLANFSDDWQEALKFLSRLADIQGVYFDSETIEIMTPQFTRTDGLIVLVPQMDFADLAKMTPSLIMLSMGL